MLIDFEPGDYVKNPSNKDWGIGQVQSIIGNKVTVNFENCGKRVINIDNVNLEKINNEIQQVNTNKYKYEIINLNNVTKERHLVKITNE